MSQPWADTPYALLPIPGMPGQRTSTNADILEIALEMTHVHNLFLRGLNAIYHQCENVSSPSDTADFALYIKIWGDSVHHHHSMEEELAFPAWDRIAREQGATTDITARNLEQHAAFEHGFELMRGYAKDVYDGRVAYDGKKVKRLLEDFAPILNEHLHDEVDMILGMEKYDGAPLRKAMDECAAKSQKEADPNTVLPMLFGCLDRTQPGLGTFPPIPFFLPYLNAYFYSRKHRSVWRFNPCTNWGKPQPLAFAKPAQP